MAGYRRLALNLLFVAAAPAWAQTRPLLTEQAFTSPAGSLVFESGFEVIASQPNFLTGRERTRWDGPLLRVVYSPSANTELDLEWVAGVGVWNDPDFGDLSAFGDVSLRAKLRLTPDRPTAAVLGARFAITLPETGFGDGLAPNTLRMRAELLLSRRFGRAAIHFNAGLAIEDEALRPHEQRDFLAWGIACERHVTRRLSIMAEASGLAGDGMPGADERGEARLGVRLGAGRWRVDAALRRGLVDATGRWGATLGFRLGAL